MMAPRESSDPLRVDEMIGIVMTTMMVGDPLKENQSLPFRVGEMNGIVTTMIAGDPPTITTRENQGLPFRVGEMIDPSAVVVTDEEEDPGGINDRAIATKIISRATDAVGSSRRTSQTRVVLQI